ncbi:unnamed protein product [Mortierella alpina]
MKLYTTVLECARRTLCWLTAAGPATASYRLLATPPPTTPTTPAAPASPTAATLRLGRLARVQRLQQQQQQRQQQHQHVWQQNHRQHLYLHHRQQ